MTYFISDLHFGHTNIINLCGRPFSSVTEMDSVLIENWNKRVKKNDTVYILGDLIWNKKEVPRYIEMLSGKKILIGGNHDAPWIKNEEIRGAFELVLPFLEVNLNSHPITMCHYPMLEWKSSREEAERKLGYHIHGHIHNRISMEYLSLYTKHNALNAGVDINGFRPVTFDELIENNNSFKRKALISLGIE